MNLELQLTDKKITFKQHQNFEDSIFAHHPLSNGYVASIITRKPSQNNKGS